MSPPVETRQGDIVPRGFTRHFYILLLHTTTKTKPTPRSQTKTPTTKSVTPTTATTMTTQSTTKTTITPTTAPKNTTNAPATKIPPTPTLLSTSSAIKEYLDCVFSVVENIIPDEECRYKGLKCYRDYNKEPRGSFLYGKLRYWWPALAKKWKKNGWI